MLTGMHAHACALACMHACACTTQISSPSKQNQTIASITLDPTQYQTLRPPLLGRTLWAGCTLLAQRTQHRAVGQETLDSAIRKALHGATEQRPQGRTQDIGRDACSWVIHHSLRRCRMCYGPIVSLIFSHRSGEGSSKLESNIGWCTFAPADARVMFRTSIYVNASRHAHSQASLHATSHAHTHAALFCRRDWPRVTPSLAGCTGTVKFMRLRRRVYT